MSANGKTTREARRDPWESVFRTVELRYGNDCRRCGRLLSLYDRALCRFCRERKLK